VNNTDNERLGLEKRKHVRIEVQLIAHFKIVGDEKQTIYHAITKDISRHGVCLKVYRCKDELMDKIGNDMPRLEVSIDIADKTDKIEAYTKTAWISGRIGWMVQPKDESTPILLGMEIYDYEKADEDKLNGYIAELLMKQRESMFD
jgi:hypothetical protein